MTFADFAKDTMRSHAVRHNFGILGETARAVPSEVQARHPEVAWREAEDTRNFVIHIFGLVNDRTVWRTVQDDLPVLKAQITAILSKGNDRE